MGEEVVERALKCLGRGFDVTRDFRAKNCKGKESLVLLSKETRELHVPGFGAVHGASVDIKCDKGERIRYQSDVLEFAQVDQSYHIWVLPAATNRSLGLLPPLMSKS